MGKINQYRYQYQGGENNQYRRENCYRFTAELLETVSPTGRGRWCIPQDTSNQAPDDDDDDDYDGDDGDNGDDDGVSLRIQVAKHLASNDTILPGTPATLWLGGLRGWVGSPGPTPATSTASSAAVP